MFILLLAFLLMWGNSIQEYLKQQPKKTYLLYDFSYTTATIGQILFTFESIGTIFSVRQILRRPDSMREVLHLTYLIVILIIFINAVVFLITYGSDGLRKVAFEYFQGNVSLIIMEWLFYLTLPCLVFICLISNSLELEHLSVVKRLLTNDFGVVVISRLMLFRLCACFLMLLPIFFIQDEIYLMTLCGGFIVPVIGFAIPIVADLKYNYKKYSKFQLLKKYLLLIFSLLLNGIFLVEVFSN